MDPVIDIKTLAGKHLDKTTSYTVFGSPEKFAELPELHKAQILFLDTYSTKLVYDAFNKNDLLCGDDGWGNRPFSDGCFPFVDEFYVKDKEERELKKWLNRRAVAFAEPAILLEAFTSSDTPAILTTWKMIVKYGQEIFSGDNLVVFSPKGKWCLHYHHDGLLKFATMQG